jgi:hypothetical protein
MRSLKRDKKGFLLAEETLKIIIAVVCIVFLIYLLIAIYNSTSGQKKIEQAKDDLSRIDKIISGLSEGESESQDISNPQGWHLYGFVGEEKPNFCTNEKCLCICEKSLIKQLTSQESKCDKKGACLVVSKLAISEIDLKIRVRVDIKNQNDRIFVEESK